MNRESLRVDDIFFKMAKWMTIPGLIFGIWFSYYGYPFISELTSCSFARTTGLPCPGCGGTRAVILLFHGKIWLSFCFHPAVLAFVVMYVHFVILYILRHARTVGKNFRKEIPVQIYAYIFAGIVIVQWIFKLIWIYFNYIK